MTSRQTRKMLKSRAEFKRAVLERDNYTCLMCGKRGTYETLDADHITGRVSGIDDVREAGATICRTPCHRLKTDRKLKWHASWLPEECIEWVEFRKWVLWSGIIWDRP